MKRLVAALICISALFMVRRAYVAPTPESYEDVQAIFDDNCVMCHAGPKAPKGLRLDGYENVIKGGQGGNVVEKGNPEVSELVKRIRGTSTPRMPLSGPPWLDEAEIKLIEDWIRNGASPPTVRSSKTKSVSEPAEPPKPGGGITYADVAQIFKANCVKCHNHKGLMGPPPEGLVLSSYQEIMNGTERAYVIPGNPDASELIRKIRGQSLPRMPFDGPPYLTANEIVLVERWVGEGAKDESGVTAEVPVGRKVRLGGQLTGTALLDGLPLLINRRTEIKKKTAPGSYVEVLGRVMKDGGIAAERIRER
ncbi:MAG: hypothetical protein KF749_11675 [Bacteroidetes bacterium]|nr:hypothetical protein [Bacteroidota bacterium]MCW5894524.1 hypothetical protein [Bacteroidota bacterium]